MNILVVDDDEVSALVLADNLRELGYTVSVAHDGEEGWAAFSKEDFPVVILDWMMPNLDGLGLCRRIRTESKEIYTYVILLTGRTERQDRLEGLEAGADDFLTKPMDSGELRARLNVARRIIASEQSARDARRMEVQLGSEIQRRLLLGTPPEKTDGLKIESLCVPARLVAGDFVEFYTYANGILDIVVGDVMGKGVPAAMIAAGIKSALEKSLLAQLSRGIELPHLDMVFNAASEQTVSELIDLNTYATLCYMRFEVSLKRLSYVNCGHPKLIRWVALEDRCDLLPTSTVPLGFIESDRFEANSIGLGVGDLIALYSDGVSDIFGGPEEFAEWVQPRGSWPISRIGEELRNISGTAPEDDFTCVLSRVTGGDAVGGFEMWSEYGALAHARELLHTFGQRHGLTEDQRGELVLAVQEAGSNALRHARPEHVGIPIGCRVMDLRDAIRVELRYPGQPFEPGMIEPKEPDPEREGGLGLAIIGRCVDEYAYGREGDWNVVSFVKRK